MTLADVRWKRELAEAGSKFPGAWTLREAAILAFLQGGSRTVRQIAAHLGMQYLGTGCRLQRVLSGLHKRGLVWRSRSGAPGDARYYYRLPPCGTKEERPRCS